MRSICPLTRVELEYCSRIVRENGLCVDNWTDVPTCAYEVVLIPDAERCGRSAKHLIAFLKWKDLHEWCLAHDGKQKLGGAE